ncbi:MULTISPECIES: DUF305 domain-containing protein [Clavibacter]|uniref:DUF305 domain-containing protein n=1 Tax=Clavibacter tessellarius TaxID=31965 RepID=A0A154V2Z6_9MICO|nr:MULTISPECIES: DUF305 domain-containing protein [Clavibacter]KZC95731.1 DUF305 domain-containing protein [Clavibacter michiganensis subsp. tessellarius]MDA3805028.1 DUF305 domain-containing protein [Clavibacter sp. CT19]
MGYRHRLAAATTALVLAAGLAGCSTPPRTPEDAASPSADADAAAPLETGSEGWNRADLAFAQDMGDHAARSVALAVAALQAADLPPGAEELAVQIRDQQGPQARELARLAEGWAGEDGASGSNGTEDREEAGGVGGGAGGAEGTAGASGSASGTGTDAESAEAGAAASDAQQQAVRSARGMDAGRLFLQGMIAQHEAAIAMADGEAQVGTSTAALDIAGAMRSSQEGQLTKMRALLASYGG